MVYYVTRRELAAGLYSPHIPITQLVVVEDNEERARRLTADAEAVQAARPGAQQRDAEAAESVTRRLHAMFQDGVAVGRARAREEMDR